MSKSIKVLLLTLLALCLAFSAAFAAGDEEETENEGETVTLKLEAATLTGTITNDVAGAFSYNNGLIFTPTNGSATAVLTFGDSSAEEQTLYVAGDVDGVKAIKIAAAGTITAYSDESATQVVTTYSVGIKEGGIGYLDNATYNADSATLLTFKKTTTATEAEEISLKVQTTAAQDTLDTVIIAANGTLSATKGDPVDVDVDADQEITGTLEGNETDGYTFTATSGTLTGTEKLAEGTNGTARNVLAEFKENNSFGAKYTIDTDGKVTLSDGGFNAQIGDGTEGNSKDITFTLTAANADEPEVLKGTIVETGSKAFVSADITVTASGKTNTSLTLKVGKASADAYQLVVDYGATVSFDMGTSSKDVVSAEVSSGSITSDDQIFVVTAPMTSGDSIDVRFAFASTDADTFVYVVKVIASGDSSSSETATETYKLSLASTDKFVFTGSNGQSATFTASVDKYSASSALASVDASGSWGTMTFNVSSDVFADFVISVDFPASASVAAVYYREGTTGSYTDAADDYTAKVLTPLEGYYRLVFSADLVASSDGVASGDGYFGFTIQVVSVDSSTSDSSSTLVEETAASVEPVTRSDGNKEIPAGKKISTKFLSSNGTLTAAIVSAFFDSNNATSVEMATPAQLTAALSQLGFMASDLGDAENGYKIVGLALPSNVTLSEGMKFFVMITTDKGGSGKSALGMGVLSSKQIGLGFLPIVFKLLKNPANTNNYMTFDAGEYFVGATNDMGESSSSTSARVVFVTAEGDTFTIAADDTTLLQGQNASGDAQAYTGDDDDDDDNQETSSHGSSSGCDAGFGALALLAVAGALAARKVRK